MDNNKLEDWNEF